MADRTSHYFEGAGASLAVTYAATGGSTSAYSSTLPTDAYDKVIVYLSVSAIVSSGKCTIVLEGSADGDNWFAQRTISTTGSASTATGCLLDSTGDKMFVFESVGAFSRILITYSSGTSLTVDLCHIEAKS